MWIKYIMETNQDAQWYKDYFAWFFADADTDKTVARRIVLYVFLPVFGLALVILWLIIRLFLKCVCRCRHTKHQRIKDQSESKVKIQ